MKIVGVASQLFCDSVEYPRAAITSLGDKLWLVVVVKGLLIGQAMSCGLARSIPNCLCCL